MEMQFSKTEKLKGIHISVAKSARHAEVYHYQTVMTLPFQSYHYGFLSNLREKKSANFQELFSPR